MPLSLLFELADIFLKDTVYGGNVVHKFKTHLGGVVRSYKKTIFENTLNKPALFVSSKRVTMP